MNFILVWLCLPLLAAVIVLPPPLRGAATARLVVVTFGLATLAAAIGTLDPTALRTWAMADSSNALFVSVSVGVVVGGVAPWPPAGWRQWVAGVPLAVLLLANHAAALRWPPLILGAVLGALPLLLARGFPRLPVREPASDGASARAGWQILMTGAVLALIEPLALTLVGPLLPLVWKRGLSTGWTPASRQLLWPLLAAIAAVALGWLSLTIAANPLVMLGGYALNAPISMAAERLLAMMATLLLVAMVAPWPFHRFGVGIVAGPAAAILAHRFATSLVPGGMPEWRTLAAMLLVVPAIGAALRGRWAHSLVVLAVLSAMYGTWWSAAFAAVSIAAALALVAASAERNPATSQRVSFPLARGTALAVAVGLAAAPAVLLSDEVVLATLLALGLATAAARPALPVPAD